MSCTVHYHLELWIPPPMAQALVCGQWPFHGWAMAKTDHLFVFDLLLFIFLVVVLMSIVLFWYRGERLNRTSLEGWMKKKVAPAIKQTLTLYNQIKGRGLKIFLISSRGEHLRDATINNLIKAGYYGWTGLILRYFSFLYF